MPTIGYRPSLETTQAVGALLLHQFARERFQQAGVDENLIREAEYMENVDELLTHTLLETLEEDQGGDTTVNRTVDSTCQQFRASTGSELLGAPHQIDDTAEITSHMSNVSNAATRNSSNSNNDCSLLNSTNNRTLTSDQNEQTYHSIQEHSLNGTNSTRLSHDKTLYHSVANSTTNHNESLGRHDVSAASISTFDRLQASPGVSLYGDELRRIADEFERSSLRQIVRNRANQVNLADITKESFTRLLKELFQEKITREKIVILFFFCTDVALRAAEFAQGLVVKLLGWSFSYIINIVCSLVHKLGGWDKVLFYQLPSLLVTCCAGLAICALLVFLRNTMRTSIEA